MFIIQSGGKGTLGFSPPPPLEFLFPTMNFLPSPLKDLTPCVVNNASTDIKDSSVILVLLGHAQY